MILEVRSFFPRSKEERRGGALLELIPDKIPERVPVDLDRDTELFLPNLIKQSEAFIRGKCSLPCPSSMDEPLYLKWQTSFVGKAADKDQIELSQIRPDCLPLLQTATPAPVGQ